MDKRRKHSGACTPITAFFTKKSRLGNCTITIANIIFNQPSFPCVEVHINESAGTEIDIDTTTDEQSAQGKQQNTQ